MLLLNYNVFSKKGLNYLSEKCYLNYNTYYNKLLRYAIDF